MALPDDLERIAAAAALQASDAERLTGVLASEPLDAGRVYLCAYESSEGHTWLAFDDEGRAIASRRVVREGATLAALCEVAEESAGGGHLTELRAQLAELREREAPEGIEDAEEAAAALEQTLQPPPRLATTEYLDAIGAAARRLERALGDEAGSPFATALQQATAAIEELADEVERSYKLPLS
jgi:hypothetical protein